MRHLIESTTDQSLPPVSKRHSSFSLNVDPLKTSEIFQIVKEQKIVTRKSDYDDFLLTTFLSNSHQVMVEPGGIEPPTSCVQGRRSPS
jgi:hypothetical protein